MRLNKSQGIFWACFDIIPVAICRVLSDQTCHKSLDTLIVRRRRTRPISQSYPPPGAFVRAVWISTRLVTPELPLVMPLIFFF